MITQVRNKWKEIILYIVFAIILISLLSLKKDFHVDEMWTYNLANATRAFWPESGVEFTPANQPYLDHHTATGHIDIRNVWIQQSADCHPPFYYVLVHLICSIFPHSFNLFYAGIINVIFQILILFIIRKIISFFVYNEKAKWIISISYILCAGTLSISTFLRMYVMLMFWVALFSKIVLEKIESYSTKDFFKLYVIAVCGTMTQYFFIVFLVYLSVVLGIIMLRTKRFREAVKYSVSMVVAAITSYLIFPSMIYHIFVVERGSNTFKALSNGGTLVRFEEYNRKVNALIFGGLMWVIILFLVIFFLVSKIILKKKNPDKIQQFEVVEKNRYLCIFIPSALYLLTIYKIAPWIEIRYASPVFAILYVGTLCIISRCLNVLSEKKALISLMGVCALIVTLSLIKCDWEFLYLYRADNIKNAEIYGENAEAICVYNDFGLITPCFREISECRSSIYYGAKDYTEFKSQNPKLSGDIALFVMEDVDEKFLNDFMNDYPQYEIVCDNGKYAWAHSYYFKERN